jgi:hypothetical protein
MKLPFIAWRRPPAHSRGRPGAGFMPTASYSTFRCLGAAKTDLCAEATQHKISL